MKKICQYLLCVSLFSLALAALRVLVTGTPFFTNQAMRLLLSFLPSAVLIGAVLLFFVQFISRPEKPVLAKNHTTAEDISLLPVTPRLNFNAIAGYQLVKESLLQVAKGLSDPEYRKTMPHGILLYGPPGTGKTLFAKCLAGEVNCPFFAVSGSEFTNRLVGQGARNVRQLYAAARKYPVSVVFIDEIDAIGGARSGCDNQEERMTLNQLLVEMDGFTQDSFVLTIAATNAMDTLDPALTRAGRFDRHLAIPAPGLQDRLEILECYAQNAGFSPSVSMEEVALMTDTCCGASLASLVREARTSADQRGSPLVEMQDIDLAFIRVATSGEPIHISDPLERKRAAYHEAGHALAGKLLLGQLVMRTSIIGSTSGLSGWTLHVHRKEQSGRPVSKEELENEVVFLYAGRAAEVKAGFALDCGGQHDIRDASEKIRSMVRQQGFIGAPLDNSVFPGQEFDIHAVSKQVAQTLYGRAEQFVAEHWTALTRVAEALLVQEMLNDDELTALLEDN